jgi:hypothetical protein
MSSPEYDIMNLMRPMLHALVAVAGALAAVGPISAQDDSLADLFEARHVALETLRDTEGRHALQFALGAANELALAAFALVHPREDREVQIPEARRFAFDGTTRKLTIAFPRNDAGLRELSGTFKRFERAGLTARELHATLLFEDGRKQEVLLRGGQLRPKGKPGCFIDAYTGANMAVLTLKAGYKPGVPDWITEPANKAGWTLLRRRIDYRKAEEEYDVAVPPGREIAALATATALPQVACLSFGLDDTDGADAARILDIPGGRLFTAAGAETLKDLAEIASLFQAPRLEGGGASVELAADAASGGFTLTLIAPGRFFGLVQGGDVEHRLTALLRLGRSPGHSGEIAESLRFVARGLTRKRADGGVDTLPFGSALDADLFERIQNWQNRFAGMLSQSLGGQAN